MTKKINPGILTIEGSARCQLRCPTCPTTGKGYPEAVGSGYLKFNDLKEILDSNPRLREVSFSNRGELFLNPELPAILEYGYQKNVAMANYSGVNLNSAGEEVLEGLVTYRFRHLLCSIDGASPETYGIYRVGGDFDRVISNIRTINRFKEKYRSEFPHLTWQFVVFGHNEHEIPLAKKMAAELGMDFVPKMSWDSEYSHIRNKEFVLAETGWPAVTREKFAETCGTNYMRSVCFELWRSPRINWDGKVMGCCWNSWGDFGGNAFRDGYIRSINSEKINHARKMLLGKAAPVQGIPCTTCKLYLEMKESGTFPALKEIFPPRPLSHRISETLARHPAWYNSARFIYRASGLKSLVSRLQSGYKS